jgi:hypothetical protein
MAEQLRCKRFRSYDPAVLSGQTGHVNHNKDDMKSIKLSLLIFGLCAMAASALAQSGGDAVPAAPEDGGTRYWSVTADGGLNLRQQPTTDAPIVSRYARGAILNNLGCQRAARGIWCDVQELGGGPRGFVAAQFLEPAVASHGATLTGPDDSAYRAGQGDFDATGSIPCAQSPGQPMSQCKMGVARAGGGDATVIVTKPGGAKRALFFQMGTAIGADTSQADGYGEFRAEKEEDLATIRVGEERYEIPDAVIFGG